MMRTYMYCVTVADMFKMLHIILKTKIYYLVYYNNNTHSQKHVLPEYWHQLQ